MTDTSERDVAINRVQKASLVVSGLATACANLTSVRDENERQEYLALINRADERLRDAMLQLEVVELLEDSRPLEPPPA